MDPYDVPTYTYTTADFPWGAFLAFMGIFLVVAIISIVGVWKVFTKAGEPGWAAIIPIYNVVVLLKISGKPLWWLFMFIIPIANIVFLVLTLAALSRSFGKDTGFAALLFFLAPIGYCVLGFGSAVYVGPGGVPRHHAQYPQQGGYYPPPQQQQGYQY